MIILLKIGIFLLNVVYFFIKLLPSKDKIVMISRQSNNITPDFELLKKEFEKDKKYEVVVLTKKLSPGFANKVKYAFHMFKQMYQIATSKVVILDSYCIVISILKHKKNLKIIQMWHAMGSLKKFGLSGLDKNSKSSAFNKSMDVNKKKKIAKAMKMHCNYDYFFVSSESAIAPFAEAFGTNPNKAVIMPLPIVDLLTDDLYKKEKTNEIKEYYPEMKNKKNIVYVPTYREEESEEKIKELIDSVNYNKYNLIIKLHPLTKLSDFDDRVIWDKKFFSRDVMIASDYIITDYSAIVYEASLLNKPMYFYIYDFDSYSKNRDFYINYKKDIPGNMSKDAKDIVNYIENNSFDRDKAKKFSKNSITLTDEKATRRIVDFVYSITK